MIEPRIDYSHCVGIISMDSTKFRNLLAIIYFACVAIERNGVASYKILGIFPTVSPSHYYVGKALMKGLAADGHEVTIISPFKEKNPIPNYTEIYLEGFYDSVVDGT